MDLSAISTVTFDCDGVMFDSRKANYAYYNYILEQVNLPAMTAGQFGYAHMHTVDETLAYLIKDADTLSAAHGYRRTMSYLPFIRYMEKEPHLDELLQSLRSGFNTAIATNRTDTMDRVLEDHNLQGAFDLVVTARDVSRPKPDPEQLYVILSHFGMQPEQMVFIGDSELDAAAARQAGVVFIAFGNKGLDADFHIQGLNELKPLLGV
ncbi:MAG: HAD family hydrolase [Desulfobacteraceae bacterium]|nr:HAD family hydrolase [Desulfobacteraceae bacterium]